MEPVIMHRLLTIAAVLACGAGLARTAMAASCDDRFPGACRVEVSTTVVTGDASATKTEVRKARRAARTSRAERRKAAEQRKTTTEHRKTAQHRKTEARKASRKRHKEARREAADDTPPMPRPRPADFEFDLEQSASAQPAQTSEPRQERSRTVGRTTPHLLVDETFNLLTASEVGDTSLESALLSRRDQMVGSAPRDENR